LQPQVIRAYGDEPGRLDDSTPENYVPVLKGREKFQAMLKLWGAALLFALAALSVWIVFVFTGRR
jgi:hypothetical protein